MHIMRRLICLLLCFAYSYHNCRSPIRFFSCICCHNHCIQFLFNLCWCFVFGWAKHSFQFGIIRVYFFHALLFECMNQRAFDSRCIYECDSLFVVWMNHRCFWVNKVDRLFLTAFLKSFSGSKRSEYVRIYEYMMKNFIFVLFVFFIHASALNMHRI